jgi:hypothetical protein
MPHGADLGVVVLGVLGWLGAGPGLSLSLIRAATALGVESVVTARGADLGLLVP